MSWGLKFVATDKEKAKAEIDRAASLMYGMPKPYAEGVKAQIDAMPAVPEGMALQVETHGHIELSQTAGSGNTLLSFVQMLAVLLALVVPGLSLAQETPKYGGCLKDVTTCFGPSVTVAPLGISLKDGTVTGGVNLGIGYGVTMQSDKWWKYGASVNLALRSTNDGQKPLISVLGSFAEYLRLGLAYQVGGGSAPFKDSAMVLVGVGADFGTGR